MHKDQLQTPPARAHTLHRSHNLHAFAKTLRADWWPLQEAVEEGLWGEKQCVFSVSQDFSSWLSPLVGIILMRDQSRIYFCCFPNPARNAHHFPPICATAGGRSFVAAVC